MEKSEYQKEVDKIIKKCKIPNNECIVLRHYIKEKLKYIITENKRVGEYYLYDFKSGEKIKQNDIPYFKEVERRVNDGEE